MNSNHLQLAAELLGVRDNTIKAFAVEDIFNDNNKIEGYICHNPDHRYGALVIFSVNNVEMPPQLIYCTPKLHYPFSTNDNGDRIYHLPKIWVFTTYVKIDGTNVNAYSYADSKGKRYVTFKSRLSPILKDTRFGDFYKMWGEMLKEFPNLKTPVEVLSGEYSFSFELYGYRNPHLIKYDIGLDTKFLFAVDQKNGRVCIPNDIPDQYNNHKHVHTYLCQNEGDARDLFVEVYNDYRDEAQKFNTILDDGMIKGTEGFVFYTKALDEDKWYLFKCKPEGVEDIHWDHGCIPFNSILATVLNLVEDCENMDDFTREGVVELLKEEFSEARIIESKIRIDKAYQQVRDKLIMRDRVIELWNNCVFDRNTKSEIMRFYSCHFGRNDMRKVYTTLRELNYGDIK